ncbi:unnamed protein product [Didymodactylos carnosus]|uniref:MULE transposase domain-containing protein n=1 Tax=Didymodactylos carnosus TaxID=1234261 RepID=A0A8S2IGH4_9BILA|nr:unnamed protein product [Didymodactylos carnosus]CAF3738552.1 unnamed protein product [Didymodactylos carnosus]
MSLQVIRSTKNKSLIIYESHLYRKFKQSNDILYWRCNVKGCKSYLHTDTNNVLIRATGSHIEHLANPEATEIRVISNKIKERVTKETTAIARIYEDENRGFHKSRLKTTPVLPTSIQFQIPPAYSSINDNRRFLLVDKTRSNERILIFATDEQLQLLFNSTQIFMDGTFDSCPPFFDQLYVIHGIEFGRQFPCVFALLPCRKRNICVKLFRYIKDNAIRLNTVFNPTRIMSDFVSGLKAAIVAEFPNAQHNGCLFHFKQAVYRRIQNLGLSTSYNSNDTIRSYCRRIMALPFLPINVVVNTFNELQDETPLAIRKNLQPLYDYFDNYWLNTIDLEKWNVYGLEHRTNNICEGWHTRFSQRVQKHHPHIWHFTDVLKKKNLNLHMIEYNY